MTRQMACDPVAAGGDTADELGVPFGHPLLRIERLTHTAKGRPIDCETLFCRAERFRWRLRLNRLPGSMS